MTVAYDGAGGARTNYGPREVAKREGGLLADGLKRCLVIPFAFDNLPSALNAGADAVAQFVPAGCPIVRATVKITTNFAGGTDYQFGLEQANGTDIDTDGLITAAVGVVANLVTTNVIFGRGAMIAEGPDAAGTAHIDADGVYVKGATGPVTSVNAYPLLTANGTFTAGAGVLYVEYLDIR